MLAAAQSDKGLRSLLPGLAAGYILMRALPVSAVSAGWELSVSLGARAGEVLSAIIFALGCAVMITARKTESHRPWRILLLACGGLYLAASRPAAVLLFGHTLHWTATAASVLDLLAVLFFLGSGGAGRRLLFLAAAGVLGLLTARLLGESACHQLLPALSAALLAGAGAVRLTELHSGAEYPVMAGMCAAMLLGVWL